MIDQSNTFSIKGKVLIGISIDLILFSNVSFFQKFFKPRGIEWKIRMNRFGNQLFKNFVETNSVKRFLFKKFQTLTKLFQNFFYLNEKFGLHFLIQINLIASKWNQNTFASVFINHFPSHGTHCRAYFRCSFPFHYAFAPWADSLSQLGSFRSLLGMQLTSSASKRTECVATEMNGFIFNELFCQKQMSEKTSNSCMLNRQDGMTRALCAGTSTRAAVKIKRDNFI